MSVILHIIPQLPPAICGVGDYSFLVGAKIEQLRSDVRCGYIACGSRAAENPVISPGHRDATGSSQSAPLWRAVGDLIDELAHGAVDRVSLLLHYSGYGFHPLGAPAWLADALDRPPPELESVRITTMFHELYAAGWPWQRAFWTSSRQRAVAIHIARLSDALITNREQNARWLEEVTGRATGSVPSMPVPSNVGEPVEVPPWEKRLPRAVTFGGPRLKRFALSTRSNDVAHLCEDVGITELVDIGSPIPIHRRAFQSRGIRVEQLGFCPRDEVSDLLLKSRIGFVDYPCDFVSKSSVVAAYAAHGLAIFLNAGSRKVSCDDVLPAYSLPRSARRLPPTPLDLASAARQTRTWYLDHQLTEHARIIMQLSIALMRGGSL